MNEDLIVNSIDIGSSLNPRIAFPLDIRQFITSDESWEDAKRLADLAALDAIEVNVVRDNFGTPIGTTIPSGEAGRDSVYYFGEPIVVVNPDKTKGVLYIIIKDTETGKGKLLEIGETAIQDFYENVLEERIHEIAYEEIKKLDVETLTDFIYTKEKDNCDNIVQLNCIKIKGIKEVDGKITIGDGDEVLVYFDDTYDPYNDVSNPLATKSTVINLVGNLRHEVDVEIANLQEEIEELYDKHEENKEYIQSVEEELNKVKAGESSVFTFTVLDSNDNEVGDFVDVGSSFSTLYFNVSSEYDDMQKITISCYGFEDSVYEGDSRTFSCEWQNTITTDIDGTYHFTITIDYGTAVKKLYKSISFVHPSFYGKISEETYEAIKSQHTEYEPQSYDFHHAFDINGLDYFDCYKCYMCSNYNDNFDFNTITSTSVARAYVDDFETQCDSLDIDERFFIKIYYSRTGYLCYVKDDPCRITNFKQTFKR